MAGPTSATGRKLTLAWRWNADLTLKRGQRRRCVAKDVWFLRRFSVWDRVPEERYVAIVAADLLAEPAMDDDAVLPTVIDMVDQPHRCAGFQISVHSYGVA